MKSQTNWLAIASFSMAIAVILGAWNAHGMETLVTDGKIAVKYLKTFHTGVEYQFVNSLGLLLLGLYVRIQKPEKFLAPWLVFVGMTIFSSTIYILCFNEMLGEGLKKLGAITPVGGLLMIAGWALAGIHFYKNKNA